MEAQQRWLWRSARRQEFNERGRCTKPKRHTSRAWWWMQTGRRRMLESNTGHGGAVITTPPAGPSGKWKWALRASKSPQVVPDLLRICKVNEPPVIDGSNCTVHACRYRLQSLDQRFTHARSRPGDTGSLRRGCLRFESAYSSHLNLRDYIIFSLFQWQTSSMPFSRKCTWYNH